MFPQIACLRGCKLTFVAFVWLFPLCIFRCVLKVSDLEDAKSHWYICLAFLHCVFSSVSSNCLPERMQSHIGCICLAFPHCMFAKRELVQLVQLGFCLLFGSMCWSRTKNNVSVLPPLSDYGGCHRWPKVICFCPIYLCTYAQLWNALRRFLFAEIAIPLKTEFGQTCSLN